MIAEEVINEIRERADIVAVIGQHVQLKKAGRSFKGLCPFHGEKTPSFNVMPDKGFFHCFGCQKHGDVFTFVMELEGKSFVEAAEQLGARFNVAVPKVDESPELRRARGERVAMLDINKHATAFFREVLADPKRGEAGRAYLEKRGIGPETTEKFQLGYATAEFNALGDYLKARKVDLEIALKLGLIRPSTRGGTYDFFRERLVCPVVVPGGEVMGFSARVVGPLLRADGTELPKYVNSSDSLVYKKTRLLFGLAQAREAMQQNGRAVLVEGNFDVITLHQADFTNVVAPLGTALTVEQVLTLKRLSDRVVLLYDGDRAGYKATMHALQTCVEADVEVLVASRPGHGKSGGGGPLGGGVDPDSMVAGGGAVQLKEAIDRALGGIEFFCFEVWGKAKGNADARTRALEEAARLVVHIQNPLKRDLVIDTLGKALDVDTGIVRAAVQRATQQRQHGQTGQNHGFSAGSGRPSSGTPPSPPPQNAQVAGSPRSVAPLTEELEVIQLLTDHRSLIGSPEADSVYWLLTDETLRAMYHAAREGKSFLELAPLLLPEPIAKSVLSGKYSDHKDPPAALRGLLEQLGIRKAKLEQAGFQKKLTAAKRGTSNPELMRLEIQLAIARKTGDLDAIKRLEGEVSSNRKQAENNGEDPDQD